MTGPEHYREAERLLQLSELNSSATHGAWQAEAAQVHATLALAAATAYPAITDYLGEENRDSINWTRATGT